MKKQSRARAHGRRKQIPRDLSILDLLFLPPSFPPLSLCLSHARARVAEENCKRPCVSRRKYLKGAAGIIARVMFGCGTHSRCSEKHRVYRVYYNRCAWVDYRYICIGGVVGSLVTFFNTDAFVIQVFINEPYLLIVEILQRERGRITYSFS